MLVHGEWLLTPERVAFHVPTETGVVADLHLGYHWTRRLAGDAVPLPSLGEQLSPLAQLQSRQPLQRIVIAGDLLEKDCPAGLLEELKTWLQTRGMELAGIIPGNHDRCLRDTNLPLFPDGYQLKDWHIIHGDGIIPEGKAVCGHWHPSIIRQRKKRPCYLVDTNRIILPAFCREAAGVNVAREKRWQNFRCCIIQGNRVLDGGFVGES